MAEPKVSWRLGDNSDVMEKWSIGKIDAGQEGEQQEILIWNNFGGEEDVAHMQDCQFTTTDSMADTLDVVVGKWVHVRCDSMDENSFTQVGGTAKKTISARGAEEGVIQGVSNEGGIADELNFAKITTYFKSDLHGVQAGPRNFKLRVEYFYV
ncbi:hypothetical protein [Bacillus atrophaeus]|uniref:hypothetical protein n=1 Tax=Bacillus atrophaeus TaxID=1452 RepID=UPI002E1C5B1C|nr:hypothetical protein [Bacillus atrophaeus]